MKLTNTKWSVKDSNVCVLLTGPLVKHIVKGAIGHPVCNYDWMRGRWSLTRPQHGQHVWVGEDSTTRWRGTHEHTETTDHYHNGDISFLMIV